MKNRKNIVHIWFLDEDLHKSAEMLTDKLLSKTIDGCIGAIVSTCMYLTGIRSKKFYAHFFSKENISSTLAEKFCGWPLKKHPKFNAYGWKESRWCRMCHENYDYVVSYLSALLDEHAYRHSSMHADHEVLQWAMSNSIVECFPYARIESISLPWKCIDVKFRSSDIVVGYRKQYCSQIEDGDAFAAYGSCRRDIPQFVVDELGLSNAYS